MEKSLTPVQQAYRKFLSGKPPVTPKNTPLGAVNLALEQRERLANILAEKKVKNASIAQMGVVIRFEKPAPEALADTILVKEGAEGDAISFLQKYPRPFIIAGLMFVVKEGDKKLFFAFPIDWSDAGRDALTWACNRQTGKLKSQGDFSA